MNYILLSMHLIAISVALGGRIILIPLISKSVKDGLNERLDGIEDSLFIARMTDYALILAFVTGITMFFLSDLSLTQTHWAFKLKLIPALLLVTDIGAFHLAKMRVVNHYDVQMIPAIKRLNIIAVSLMSCMVLFASFSA